MPRVRHDIFLYLMAVVALTTSNAFADSQPFFTQDAAKTVFGPGAGIEIPKFKESEKPETGEVSKVSMQPEASKKEVVATTDYNSPQNQRDKKAQDIISKYGSPDTMPAIRTVENAPPEFKGMMEALDNGLDELAYQYAKQWQVRIAKLATLTNKVGSMMPQIKKELSGDESGNINVNDEQSLANRVLNEKARKILEQAGQDLKLNRAGVDVNSTDRAAIRDSLIKSGKVPVDPQGQVNVLYFINPTDLMSDKMTAEIEALRRAQNRDLRVNIVGVTTTPPLPGAIQDYKARNHTNMAVSNGASLAEQLGVDSAPAVVLMSPNTKKAVIEHGYKSWVYLDEMVQIMKGER